MPRSSGRQDRLKPKFSPRPDWVTVADFDPQAFDPPVRGTEGAVPNLGDYIEGFGDKLTMIAYAKPAAFPAPLDNLAACGHGLLRVDKRTRKITIECWPRGVDVTQPGAKQYPGWRLTFDQRGDYGRQPVAWLPEVEGPADVPQPIVQVIDDRTGELVCSLRVQTPRFKPWVFADGLYTIRIGELPDRMTTQSGLRAETP